MQYDFESSHSYYNTILKIIPQLLQYNTESFHSYYNTVFNHPTVITIRYWVIPVITIRYWVIPQLLQYDTESSHS